MFIHDTLTKGEGLVEKLKGPKELIIEELCDIVTSNWKEEGVITTPRFNIRNICNVPIILYEL